MGYRYHLASALENERPKKTHPTKIITGSFISIRFYFLPMKFARKEINIATSNLTYYF